MEPLTLEHLVVGEIFATLLIFTRIGTAIMLMPIIGDSYVSPRIRLLFALGMSFLLMPILKDHLPAPPGSPMALAVMVAGEACIGVFMGMLTKMLLSTMHTAGMLIATQSGLATAMLFDASQSTQSSTIGVLLSLMATLCILGLDLHHAMLSAFVDSYTLFTPGRALPLEDIANYLVRAVGTSFDIAIRIASPVIVIAVFINLGGAVLARLMPQMPVFFLLMPAQLMFSFFVLVATLSMVMLVFTEYAKESIGRFLVL